MEYPVPYAAAFNLAAGCLTTIGIRVSSADATMGVIRADKSMTVWSWGDDVLVLVRSVGDERTQVEVTSSLKFGLYDWGSTSKTVARIHEAIAAAISRGLGSVGATPAAWHPDPFGRHEHRWWDGNQWTASVSDHGVVATDPPS